MDREFLFGILAVQTGLASPQQVMSAASAYLIDKTRTISDRLLADGVLKPAHAEMLGNMVSAAIKAHGGDVQGTLHSLGGDRAVLTSFGGSIQLDPRGELSIVPRDASSVDDAAAGAEATTVTSEQTGRYVPRGGSAEAAEIGRGGLGRVWIASDEHLGREVAIKELLADGSGSSVGRLGTGKATGTSGLVMRFLREARVTGQLEHPNIVPVHEVGRRADGAYYYAMRLVRGRTLDDALKGCRSLDERLKLLHHFVDLCNAVAYAHSRGVVHRDLKPANVMIGEFGETVVLDWGLAKVRGKEDIRGRELEKEVKLLQDAGAGHTVDGSAIGTPAYMSPEQADGAIAEIDERSDVWSLGAVLFELLAGRPPYEGATPFEIIGKVLKDPAPAVREFETRVPKELAAVTMKALERDKSRRYDSARELASEIDAYLSGGRIRAYEYSSWELISSFVKRNRAASVATGLLMLLVVASAVGLYDAYRREGQERARAQANEAAARAQEKEARDRELESELNLATALGEKANRLLADKRTLEARLYAAASLVHNPANPKGPRFTPGFEDEHADSVELRAGALSTIFQAKQRSLLHSEVHRSVDIGVELPAASIVWPKPDRWWVLTGGIIRRGDRSGKLHDVIKADARLTALTAEPGGDRLVAGGEDGIVRVYDSATGREQKRFVGPKAIVRSVAFANERETVVAAYDNGAIRTWRTEDARAGWEAMREGQVVTRLISSPDGTLVASGTSDAEVAVWDARTGRQIATFATGRWTTWMAFSPDSRWLASVNGEMTVSIIDLRARSLLHSISLPDQSYGLAFSTDGRVLITGANDGVIRLWNVRNGRLLDAARAHGGGLTFALAPGGGKELVSMGSDKRVRLWSVDTQRSRSSLDCNDGDVSAAAASPDGARLALGGWGPSVCIWELATTKRVEKFPGNPPITWSVGYSPDGRTLALGGQGQGLVFRDLASGSTRSIAAPQPEADVVFLNGGREVVIAAYDESGVRVLDIDSGREVRSFDGFKAIAVSPDERLLATSRQSAQTKLFVYELSSGKLLFEREANEDAMWVAAFSPDGRWLATGGKLGSVLVWDTKTFTDPRRFEGHGNWINRMSFSPDSALLATGSDDRTARIWSVETGRTRLVIRAPQPVVPVRFTTDGKTLAVGEGPMVHLYDVDFAVWDEDANSQLEQAEKAAGLRLRGVTAVPYD